MFKLNSFIKSSLCTGAFCKYPKNAFYFEQNLCSKQLPSIDSGEQNGFDTHLSVYNSATKRKEKLHTRQEKIVSWYCCGPTVYDSAHIGHGCSYVHFDIIRRIMEKFFDLNVVMLMNITDIDDKIIKRANSLKQSYKTVALQYEKEFFEDMNRLNVMPPNMSRRVSDHIPDIITFIEDIVRNGFGYRTTDGSVYFSLSKFLHYGKLINTQKGVSDSEVKEKPQDFALWKSAKPGEPSWASPWGEGRPGWHIECSVIASKVFGKYIDIHSGGIDLKFPHHENEEAQCCAKFNVSRWVKYWIHTGHLFTKENIKMSKSLRNTISIKHFLEKYTSNHLRMFCLMIPYRNGVEFRTETIEKAVALDKRLTSFLSEVDSCLRAEGGPRAPIDESLLLQVLEDTRRKVLFHLSDDLDTPTALSHLFHLISVTNSVINSPNPQQNGLSGSPYSLAAVRNYIKDTFDKFGYNILTKESISERSLEDILEPSIEFRRKVRQRALSVTKQDPEELQDQRKQLLEACDTFREDLLVRGVELKDHIDTTTWRYLGSGK